MLRLVRLGQEEGTLRRALADVLSGEIAGAGFRPRVQAAGSGVSRAVLGASQTVLKQPPRTFEARDLREPQITGSSGL